MALLPLRPVLLTVAAALAAAATVVTSAGAAAPSDAELLAAIRAEAPGTSSVAQVSVAAGGAHVAVRTRAQGADEASAHDELWLASGDGTTVEPLSRSAGSGASYVSIGSVAWSADGGSLTYGYLNPAVKGATAAHVVSVGAAGPARDVSLGSETFAPEFSADGRYVTFLQNASPRTRSSGALDLASGAILLPARVDVIDGSGESPWLAPECARAAEQGWVPAQSTGRWLEQALAAPDPGCRWGANAADPAPSTSAPTTPDVLGASDAPPSITRAVGDHLVTIAERARPVGPTIRIRSSAKGLTRAIRRGLRIRLDLAGARTVKAYVIAERPRDEGLLTPSAGTGFTTLGRAAFRDLPSQTQTLAIPFTRAAKRGLPRFLKITVTVRIVATDKAGNRTTVERDIALTDF